MQNGVPFDVAFSLPSEDALAYAVAFGEMEGGASFDWDNMRWRERK